jgi:hypothetical protein
MIGQRTDIDSALARRQRATVCRAAAVAQRSALSKAKLELVLSGIDVVLGR